MTSNASSAFATLEQRLHEPSDSVTLALLLLLLATYASYWRNYCRHHYR
jgi:hypothetical protein